ncbi:LysM peptidoglycan-binding domain-containing protein [Actomonas aquatica]|uniref:LysM peptidoglycan-binding domain-containing protein n=1 Tax=Actomonas aquatica TaxID=2866162 RepID=A0ABZ1C9P9_9BACT|nr:LysM peptidoglycan-binding domain-containing protein [Opitutus sp. WL0086]WRQ88201.1 LysM peptidoglycan-binding domain-containing protein [Opitutus sp. WL0086]
MIKRALIGLLSLTLCAVSWAQYPAQNNLGSQVAGLREDVRILVERVGQMALRIEQLERENARLLSATDGLDSTYATVRQLNDAVAELTQQISSGDATSRAQAAKAVQELARQVNVSMDGLAKDLNARRQVTAPTFNDDFPKEGIRYTVEKGDTLSSIASRFGSTVKDIQNANRITDPRKVQVGQTLFIPGAQ